MDFKSSLVHFADYAVSLMERKVQTRELRSPLAIENWRHVLSHLIGGTSSEDGEYHVPGFGELALDEMRVGHIERWRASIAELIRRGEYSPRTINGWIKTLKVILKQAASEFELPRRLNENVKSFDTADHPTYTEEDPNSLTPEQVKEFLALMLEYHPHHYAMTFLGFCTGLRPCTLRPIRRKGPNSDLLWDQRKLLVRQSQTLGREVLQTTKQRTRYSVHLPQEAIEVLRWHVDSQLTVLQQGSDLLFPSVTGTFRSASVLNKPFAEISEMMNLGFVFTQQGMRRTFNDLAREAQVNDLVTCSVSGHLTEEMQRHYSSVRSEEQEAGLAKVVDLMMVKARVSGDRRGDRPQEVVTKQEKRPARFP